MTREMTNMTAYLIAHPNGFTETAEGLVELEQMLPMPDEARDRLMAGETVTLDSFLGQVDVREVKVGRKSQAKLTPRN